VTIIPIPPQEEVLDAGLQEENWDFATTTESDEEEVCGTLEDDGMCSFEEEHTRMVAGMGLHLVLTRATGPERRVRRSSRIARLRAKGVVPNYRC